MACAEPARRQAPYGDDCAEPLPAAPSNCPAVASLRGTATMPPRSREVWQSGADEGRFYHGVVTGCSAALPAGGGDEEGDGWGGLDLWECVSVKWEDDPVETQVSATTVAVSATTKAM